MNEGPPETTNLFVFYFCIIRRNLCVIDPKVPLSESTQHKTCPLISSGLSATPCPWIRHDCHMVRHKKEEGCWLFVLALIRRDKGDKAISEIQ